MKRRFPSLEVAFFDVVEILHIVVSVNRYIVPIIDLLKPTLVFPAK